MPAPQFRDEYLREFRDLLNTYLREVDQRLEGSEAHQSKANNPHSVTRAQLGAAAQAALDSHAADQSNPHGVTASQAGAAPASHVGSGGSAHPAATASQAGFLWRLPRTSYSPAFAPYSLSPGSATWARLSPSAGVFAPRIDLPALGTPPAGLAWYVDVGGIIRLTPDVACDIYIGAGIGTDVPLNGSAMVSGISAPKGGHMFIPIAAKLQVPNPAAAFVVTFTMQTVPAANFTIQQSPLPSALAYLAAA